ncbi:MAG: exopolyphosphatase [Sedimentibacter sp.]|uniref:exopolyphosphatase n=1 Tax=Sedimentibacter sp. TaxID=1960295 RepID=UPI002980D9B8|nr:exopolyphosphatase [Sedimentibacter sp.]MDW5299188.1 exopolyphosphatase [Sedimentibacter sp.]
MEENVAIIDLGSNSVRILVIKINFNSSYKMIDQFKEMVRLSEGMWEDNLLKETAIERTIAALKQFKNILKSHNVNKTIAIATAAVRNSVNGKAFLQRVYSETEFNFNVISGEEEAYLDYLGVINSIDIENCIIIDTGGGSTELILVKDRKVQNSISIPYGAVTLTEMYLDGDALKENIVKAEEFIRSIYQQISWLDEANNVAVVGLGGSIRTLSKIHKKKHGFLNQSMHNYNIASKDIHEMYDIITSLKSNELKNIPGLKKERADIIAGGLIPLKVLLDFIGSDRLIVSGNGLREGAFFKHYFDKYKLNGEIVNSVLQHSIDNVLLKYDVDLQHSYRIRKLSLDLYDQLDSLHQLDGSYRKLLEVGSLLHDVGLHIDYYDHHYHGFYLAINSKINGLSYRELVICAFIVGMHRNEDFKQDWADYYPVINQDDYNAIQKLSLFVRISEELCKSQNGNIKELKCSIKKNNVNIIPINYEYSGIELPTYLQSEKAFKKIFFSNMNVKSE